MRPDKRSHPELFSHFKAYEEFHRHPVNLLTHKIAIPLIVFHVVAMLDWLKIGDVWGIHVTGAMVAVTAFFLFYWKLHPPYATMMLLVGAFSIRLGHVTPMWLVFGLGATAWTLQLAGHVFYEQRQPGLTKKFTHPFIAPLFMLAVLDGTVKPRPWNPPA